ncbi:MAG: alpha/beta fold hydrolase [Silvanigrellales bacterium]|nr:alpha/beta fold hydrolase [Silvanigrellales bacterium]
MRGSLRPSPQTFSARALCSVVPFGIWGLCLLSASGCLARTFGDGKGNGAQSQAKSAASLLGGIVTPSPVITPISRIPAAAKVAWDAYTLNVRAVNDLQPGCEPTVLEPKADIALKGAITLFHGYSACPQQFLEFAQYLNAAGYIVVLPLLPGHGRKQVNGSDDNWGVPRAENALLSYGSFAATLNGVMETMPGTRIVGGLSVGGAVALYAAHKAPGLYARQLIMAPFLNAGSRPAGDFLSVTVETLSFLKGSEEFSKTRIGWGADCEKERAAGRGGFCTFSLDNLAGAQRLGWDVSAALTPAALRTQFVGVEGDTAVDNERNNTVFGAITAEGSGGGAACLYPLAGKHSFISRFDNLGSNMTWLPEFFSASVAFVDAGTPFPTDGPSTEAGVPRCKL